MKLNEILVRSTTALIKPSDNFKTVIRDKTSLINEIKDLCMDHGVDGSDYNKLMNSENQNGDHFAELYHSQVHDVLAHSAGPLVAMYVSCRAYADARDTDRTIVGFQYRKLYLTLIRLPVDGKDTWFHRSLKITPPSTTNYNVTTFAHIDNIIKQRSHNLDDHENILAAGKINPDNYFEGDEIFVAGWLIYQ